MCFRVISYISVSACGTLRRLTRAAASSDLTTTATPRDCFLYAWMLPWGEMTMGREGRGIWVRQDGRDGPGLDCAGLQGMLVYKSGLAWAGHDGREDHSALSMYLYVCVRAVAHGGGREQGFMASRGDAMQWAIASGLPPAQLPGSDAHPSMMLAFPQP